MIAGAAGVIGRVLSNGLNAYDLRLVDTNPPPYSDILFKNIDVANYKEHLKDVMIGHDVVIHLAHDMRENFDTRHTIHDNKIMIENIYSAALKVSPHPRVIVASSVHAAGGHINWDIEPYTNVKERKRSLEQDELITVAHGPAADSPYAATKIYGEELGRWYATQGLRVVCVRFGGVNERDEILEEPNFCYHAFWLSKQDCTQFVKCCIEATLPQYSVFFAISNNKYKVVDISDARKALGYMPVDDAAMKRRL